MEGELENQLNQLREELKKKNENHRKEMNQLNTQLNKLENVLSQKKKEKQIEKEVDKASSLINKGESDMIYIVMQGLNYKDGSGWNGENIVAVCKTYEEGIAKFKNLVKVIKNYKTFSDHPTVTTKKGWISLIRAEADMGHHGMFYELYAIKIPK